MSDNTQRDDDKAAAARAAKRRNLQARAAAHASWANTSDRTARTSHGTRAFLARFERQVDPHGRLPDDERFRMALHARTAYMLQLARRSAMTRQRTRGEA
jgi:hypothetical protein